MDRTRVQRLAEDEHGGAKSTLRALRDLSFQLSGAQLGITITSLLVGFIVEPTIGEGLAAAATDAGLLPEDSALAISVTVALVVATAIQMVLGELLPKNLAVARPLRMSFAIATPLRLVNALLRPLIGSFNAAANATVRLIGIEPRDELTSEYSLEELEVMIRSSRKEGAIAQEDFSLLARAISFGEKTADEVLVPRTSVVAIQRNESLAELARLALESGHSRLPVYGENLDDIAGVAHIRDSYPIPAEERSRIKVESIMRDALIVPESHPLDALLARMRRERNQMAIVLDEFGGTAGIVTLEDLLEEIVGEIEDEYDPRGIETRETSPQTVGICLLSGLLHADDVREQSGFVMPEGDYETLGGFLFSLFGRIPQVGEHTAHESWEFKVTEMDGNRIATVLAVCEADPEVGRS